MSTSYRKLFRIASQHDYFQDNIPRNITYWPTEETMRLLRRHRLTYRTRPGELTVYFQSLDGTNPLIPVEDERFTFLMSVEYVEEFLNYTDLDTSEPFEKGKKIHFINDPVGTPNISHGLIDKVKVPQFTYTSPVEAGTAAHTLTLELKHLKSDDTTTLTDIPATDDLKFVTPIDLSKSRAGLYEFKSTHTDTAETKTERLYIDAQLAFQTFFGLVEIDWESGSVADYTLQFSRKSTIWNYILVNKSSRPDFGSLEIKDKGTPSGPYEVNFFVKLSGLTIGGVQAFKFRSARQIPFYELPKTDIEVVKEVGGNDIVVYENLSNPVVSQVGSSLNESDIYVFV